VALLERAAGQGHAYAMETLASIHSVRKEHEEAAKWHTKGAEAGLPKAMYNLGVCFDTGEGLAAPDHPAAADWYRRAADAGHGDAAYNLRAIYSVGRGRAGRLCLPRTYVVPCSMVKWHHVTRQAITAVPWAAASSAASERRCNGRARPP